jgi:uncharacterized protein YheU (UPF0270 family)
MTAEIAFDGGGNAIAAWRQVDSAGIENIYVNRYIPGTGWGTEQPISPVTGSPGFKLAVSHNGHAIVLWKQVSSSSTYEVYASRYTPAGGWEAAQVIDTAPRIVDGHHRLPKIAMDRHGNAIVVWSEFDSTTTDFSVFAQRYIPSAGWQAPQKIDTVIGSNNILKDGFAHIAFDNNGNALAVWSEAAQGVSQMYASRFTSAGVWETAQSVLNATGAYTYASDVAFDPNGNAMLVWIQGPTVGEVPKGVFASRYTAAGGWEASQRISSTNPAITNVAYASLVFDRLGNAIAIWQADNGGARNLYSNRYTATANSWGTAELIESRFIAPNAAPGPKLVGDPNGNAIIIWELNMRNIAAKRYMPTSGWGARQLIGVDNGGNNDLYTMLDPNVAMDANGNAIAVWAHSLAGAPNKDIFANRFD